MCLESRWSLPFPLLLKPCSFFPENHLILLECSPHFSLLRAARQVQHLPLWGLFKSKLNSSRQVFTECIKKHIALHYLLSDTNNCKTQSISGHKLVMVGNTPLVPMSRNRLEAAAKMLVLIMSPAPGTSPRGFWTRGQVNPASNLLFQLRQAVGC